jgi:hypothetical protein
MLVLVFGMSMFASAALLFLVEPMLAKMMLPLLGGAPAVWNTCLVFFQASLLAGYLYAHGALRWLGRRTQMALHCALVLLPLLPMGLLPLHLPTGWNPPVDSNPAPWVMAILFVSVGLPFFILSSNTPLVQQWFAGSDNHHSGDPYFLYAASNTGSLAGLLAYPLLLEPLLSIPSQSHLWSYGYWVFAALTLVCAGLVWRIHSTGVVQAEAAVVPPASKGAVWERLRWIALAFVPSSMMLGVTTAITTDVPALPLFWVLPLTLYLASFVLVFARKALIPHRRVKQILPAMILVGLLPGIVHLKLPLVPLIFTYLSAQFCVAMYCHGELSIRRPHVQRLTEFYLLISVGGVLGGAFNSLLAPVVFHSALEFPIVMVFAALLRSPGRRERKATAGESARDWLLPTALGATMATIIVGVSRGGYKPAGLAIFLFFAYSALWCFSFHRSNLRFALGLIALLTAGSLYTGPYGRILATERNFFGVIRVTDDPTGKFRLLIHAGTNHGMQSLDPARSREPLSYFTRSGPAGQIFRAMNSHVPNAHVAVVGLGAGSMACLTTQDEALTFYEIDPLVVRFAEDPHYFTFLKECGPHAQIVLGDARLKLHDAPDSEYEVIALDAFSGDSIPVHLLTRQALALYLHKLAPGGILAFHISSLYLNLEPTLGNLARDAHLVCYINRDTSVPLEQVALGKLPSVWLVMARNKNDLAGLVNGPDSPWKPAAGNPNARVWTDDYSNLLSVVHWK